MKKNVISIVLVIISFMACSPTTYTLDIPASKLQKTMDTNFPIKKNVIMGDILIKDPKIILKNKSKRILTGLTFEYKPPFFATQKGILYISSKVLYNKEKKSFFLKDAKINEMKFNDTTISNMLPNSFKGTLSNIMNEIFSQYPIYKVNTNSLKGKIINKTLKETNIKDGKLSLTFGL